LAVSYATLVTGDIQASEAESDKGNPNSTLGEVFNAPTVTVSLSTADRLLVLAVHPDDESLCAGGIIQRAASCGAKVLVVFITNGDDNPWPQRFVEWRWHIGPADRARWGQRRRREALAALVCLGISEEHAQFWGFPDQGITEILMAGRQDLLARLSHVIGEWLPSVIVGPSKHDLHPDHNSLAVLLEMALKRISPPSNGLVEWRYLAHARADRSAITGAQLLLSPEEVAAKRRAILSHHTQMALCQGRFLTFVRPAESFLAPDERVQEPAGPCLVKAEFVEESLVLTMDRIRRPAVIMVSAESARGAVGRVVKIPAIGDIFMCDGSSGEILARARIIHGEALVLPAGPFASATAVAVKFAGGFGIFDRSGWQMVELRPLLALKKEALVAPPRTCCVIPCYNIASVCGAVVRGATRFADMVIAVNDGSTDETESILREVAAENPERVHVLSFAQNRGKGVVLIEAFRHALATLVFDVLVTLDGDAQHRPEDIPCLARALAHGRCSLVIGERLARSKMPLRSRFGNTLTALVMRAFYPAAPTDTQSGLRAFRPDFVREIVERIDGGRYETELKMLLLALTREYQIGSVTIPTVYIAGNRLSNFRPLVDSWKIYRTLLSWRSREEVAPGGGHFPGCQAPSVTSRPGD
jgi:LmbE family N-acetylglucosaminyl deacetylase